MRRRRLPFATIALLVMVHAMAVLVAACGGASGAPAPDESTAAALGGTAAERAAAILGQEPSGLAKAIVDRGTVVVANDADYPPQSFIDEKTGELVGFDVDVAKRMAEILGLEVQFENPVWETIPAGLRQGRFDVSIGSMPITPESQKALAFTDPYYYTFGQVFVKEGGPQITGVADLAGKKVGVGAATTHYDFLKEESKAGVKVYTTDSAAFPDLRSGSLDFVMMAAATGQKAISQGQPFEFSGDPLHNQELALAIKKGEADWLALLDYCVKTMHGDGSLTDMSLTWYDGLDLTKKAE